MEKGNARAARTGEVNIGESQEEYKESVVWEIPTQVQPSRGHGVHQPSTETTDWAIAKGVGCRIGFPTPPAHAFLGRGLSHH